MDIRYFLEIVASKLVTISVKFIVLGVQIQSIYLIGQYLAQPFLDVGIFINQAALRIYSIGLQWDDFYYELQAKLNSLNLDNPIFEYANKLINFIVNPKPTVLNAINQLFPNLQTLVDDTYNYLKPIIQQVINEVLGTVQSIAVTIENVISILIPDFSTLRYNPVSWVIKRLQQYSSSLYSFIQDPSGYIRERIKVLFPDLQAFLNSPRDYILEKVVDGFELSLNRYILRLQKIIERALANLF